jgi:predicted transcriptional regulator of viral defense system
MDEMKYEKYRKIFLRHSGILRASRAEKLGIPKHMLYEMLRKEMLVRESKGLYRLAEVEPLSNPDLVQVSLLVPRSVICLVSALYFYRLTTQIPHQVYIALPRDTKSPRLEHPPLKVFHFGERAYSAGIQEHLIDGVSVRIYNREKTIADMFKYRQKLGVDLAIEALRDYMRQPHANLNEVMRYAKVNRIENILRPYLESLV